MAQITDVNTRSLANPSTRTIAERKKFAGLVDEFATFTWDNIDMFNEFGAFIINDKKGSLKFYNGASFKNEYSKPQFQNGYTNISGISFDTQKISFQVGIYWISIEDYRVLMNFLHPYKVSFLSFSFEKEYGYYCKLADIKDSTRHIIGKENGIPSYEEGVIYHLGDKVVYSQQCYTCKVNNSSSTWVAEEWESPTSSNNLQYSKIIGSNQSGYRYYTELQLTFEVIGAQCAKSTQPAIANLGDWTHTLDLDKHYYDYTEMLVSDLDMPLQIHLNFRVPTSLSSSNLITWAITGEASIKYTFENNNIVTNKVTLFQIELKNLRQGDNISLIYDAEQGLIYWKTGEKENIVSLLSTNDSGMRIINGLNAKQFAWPGRLNHKEIQEGEKHLTITTTNELSALQYTRQKRTNVL